MEINIDRQIERGKKERKKEREREREREIRFWEWEPRVIPEVAVTLYDPISHMTLIDLFQMPLSRDVRSEQFLGTPELPISFYLYLPNLHTHTHTHIYI